jgi:hypothetical protein
MLQIRLGTDRVVDPATDPLGRSRIGWRPGMSEQEAWEAGRGVWKLKTDRALEQDEVQVIALDGTVLAVATVTGISKHGDRYALQGTLRCGDSRIGHTTSTPHRSRNSVAYF